MRCECAVERCTPTRLEIKQVLRHALRVACVHGARLEKVLKGAPLAVERCTPTRLEIKQAPDRVCEWRVCIALALHTS